jgi:hypothetical protein
MTNQEIQNILSPIQESHFNKAMEIIDTQGIPPGRNSQSYDVLNKKTGRKYPPPYLIELAYKLANGKDLPTNFFDKIRKNGPHFQKIESLGLVIIEKRDKALELIQRYKNNIQKTHMLDEVYKWKLIDEFKGRPNIEAEDFSKEIHSLKFDNLAYTMAPVVLRTISKAEPEALRTNFIQLFDENVALESRMIAFNQNTLAVYRAMGETNPHHQDERSMATYLTYHNPSKYTLYKSGFYIPFCNLMGVEVAVKNKKYIHYLELLDKFINTYIAEDKELIELVKSYIPEYYDGTNHLLLAQDILFTMLNKEGEIDHEEGKINYWIYAPGKKAFKWDEFFHDNIMALNWDELGDLNDYSSQTEIAEKLKTIEQKEGSKMNDAKACFDFVHNIKEGDVVFVKRGNSALLGYGIVTGRAIYDDTRIDFKNIRNVEWKLKGEWNPEHTLVQKTLTDITKYTTNKKGFKHYYERLFDCMGVKLNSPLTTNKALVPSFTNAATQQNLLFSSFLTKRYIASLATKPFVIFTGLSGSGKTKLAQTFAKWICEDETQYKIIPVGADWTNREPLLGYPNSLDPNSYVLPDNGALDLIIAAIDNAKDNQLKDCKPYFLILDEMNLSHVERYFADFLSGMESKEGISLYTGNDRKDENGRAIPKEITLPPNLFLVGTVNIDETTYMFSPKVLDRANTIEFRVDKNDLLAFFEAPNEVPPSTIDGAGTSYSKEFMDFVAKDTEGKTNHQEQLLDFFEALQPIGSEFGYRTANEMNRLMAQLEVLGLEKNEHALDVAVMQKLLPKLHGSRTKLNKVLPILASFCFDSCSSEQAKALLDEVKQEGQLLSDYKPTLPLSFAKIARMYAAAQENGFASYAEQ